MKVTVKLQASKCWTAPGSEHPGIESWVSPPGKETLSAEELAENKGNIEWVVEEGSLKYQLWPWDQ